MDADTKRGAELEAELADLRGRVAELEAENLSVKADLDAQLYVVAEVQAIAAGRIFDKAVLDAAKSIPDEYLRRKRRSLEYREAFDHRHARTDVVKNELSDFCDAELARREAAK